MNLYHFLRIPKNLIPYKQTNTRVHNRMINPMISYGSASPNCVSLDISVLHINDMENVHYLNDLIKIIQAISSGEANLANFPELKMWCHLVF